MRVKLMQVAAGPGGVYQAGAILDVETATAKHLIETRQAAMVEEEEESSGAKKKAAKKKAAKKKAGDGDKAGDEADD